MSEDLFGSPVLAQVVGVPVTAGMVGSAVVTVAVLALAGWLGRAAVHRPTSAPAAAARLLVGFLQGVARDGAGRDVPALTVFGGTLFVFVAGSALYGQLPGVRAPTADLAVASALALVVFVAVPVAGVWVRGPIGYLRHYLEGGVLLAPIEVISELSRTLALALRLFGNMMSGHLVVGLLVSLVGLLVPVPLMALDLAIGLIQAYIFTILACVYVGAAIQVEETA
ncbi:MAG: F0F1 ATP synthase subunit A [Alphaproteobacteria bacterium]|nr:F0F1 ATP synthase subunit A [Alphaproteobacteria bacterium]MCB9694073.1 F0F1 ATP synthase subunit A [Alphaproteobacteria bacterium]